MQSNSNNISSSSNDHSASNMAEKIGLVGQSDVVNDVKYCKVCRLHYGNGRKHKYSATHVKKFKEMVNKFTNRVNQCEKYFSLPAVVSGEFEPGASFWCQVCEKKVSKHVTNRTWTINFGGTFEHLASPSHHKNTHQFWKVNGGDKKLKKCFIISDQDYASFKLRCQEALERAKEEQEERELKIAENIRLKEIKRQELVSIQPQPTQVSLEERKTVNNSHGVLQNPTGWHNGQRVWKGGIVKLRPKSSDTSFEKRHRANQDYDAYISNLPFLSRVSIPNAPKDLNAFAGNIHTGAVPPWLRNDDEDISNQSTEASPIGPSYEDFLRHVDNSAKKKKKKNNRSVGFNFDHTSETSDEWLPSFGRVWNSGPRWQSRQEYKKETKKKPGKKS